MTSEIQYRHLKVATRRTLRSVAQTVVDQYRKRRSNNLRHAPSVSEIGDDLVARVLREVPDATDMQARRALAKAWRRATGTPPRKSGSKATFSAVASPDELAAVRDYASRHNRPRASAFHDGVALLRWLEQHGLARDLVAIARSGADPRNVIDLQGPLSQ